ncbi:MAG: DUF983 domain-containing protein [Pseudomonadota bacterium]
MVDVAAQSFHEDRSLRLALRRGWRRRCPACGSGPMMQGFLTVRRECPVCSEELHHHRADDGPAWLTILITGHLLAPLMLFVFTTWRPEGWMMAIGFSLVFTTLALYLLPRVKGCFVALQWAKRMYGFAGR